jgi:hypothetical protein
MSARQIAIILEKEQNSRHTATVPFFSLQGGNPLLPFSGNDILVGCLPAASYQLSIKQSQLSPATADAAWWRALKNLLTDS